MEQETERGDALQVYEIDKQMKEVATELKRRSKIKLYFPKNLTWTEEEWNKKGIIVKWEK